MENYKIFILNLNEDCYDLQDVMKIKQINISHIGSVNMTHRARNNYEASVILNNTAPCIDGLMEINLFLHTNSKNLHFQRIVPIQTQRHLETKAQKIPDFSNIDDDNNEDENYFKAGKCQWSLYDDDNQSLVQCFKELKEGEQKGHFNGIELIENLGKITKSNLSVDTLEHYVFE